jgi:hypothetical protein
MTGTLQPDGVQPIPPAGVVPAVAAPPATIFALAPALVHNRLLDYSTSGGAKASKASIEPLFHDEYFNCEASDLFTFIGAIDDRADQNG